MHKSPRPRQTARLSTRNVRRVFNRAKTQISGDGHPAYRTQLVDRMVAPDVFGRPAMVPKPRRVETCRSGGSTGPSGLSIFHLVFFYFPLSPPVALSASPSTHPGKTRPTYLTTRPAPAPTRRPWICIGNAGQSAGRLLDHTRARETTLPPSHEAVDCMTWTLFRLYWRAGLVNGPKKFLSLQIPFGWTKNK